MVLTEKDVCSKRKMIDYLMSLRIDTKEIKDDYKYLFSCGVNSVVDIVIVGIYLGEFDKPKEQKPKTSK